MKVKGITYCDCGTRVKHNTTQFNINFIEQDLMHTLLSVAESARSRKHALVDSVQNIYTNEPLMTSSVL